MRLSLNFPDFSLPGQQTPQLSVGEGMRVAQLGFGTWSWGNKLLWGYDEANDAKLQEAFDTVFKQSTPFDGRRFFFDTGDSYGTGKLEGRAEQLLGTFRREIAKPERCVIGTKLAIYPSRLTGASFEDACRSSLQRMGREQIELVQAHWSAQNFQPWQEPAVWDGLARCHEAGLARAVGTSNYGPKQLVKANTYWRERGVPHTVNQVLTTAFSSRHKRPCMHVLTTARVLLPQVQLSLLSQLPLESGQIESCRELGVTPIGYSPLALGVLSGKYDEGTLPEGPRGLIFRALLPSCRPLLGTLREIAQARGVSMSAVAINWCMGKGCLVIVGMKSPEQVADNLAALTFTLGTAEVDELERAAAKAKKATQNIFQTV
jgi:pyridoxine 4-dehydrogenase